MATSGASEAVFSGRSRFALRLDVKRTSVNVGSNSAGWYWQLRVHNLDKVSSSYALDDYAWSITIAGQSYSGSAGAFDFRDGAEYHTLAATTTFQGANAAGNAVVQWAAAAGPASLFGSATTSGAFNADRIPKPPSDLQTPTFSSSTDTALYGNIYTPGDNGGSAIIDFTVQLALDSGFSNIVQQRVSPVNGAGPQNWTGLEPATTYFVRYSARNSEGSSDWSTVNHGNTKVGVPSGPDGPFLGNVGPTTTTVTWGPPADTNGGAVTNYKIQRATNSTFTANLIEYTQDVSAGNGKAFSDLVPNTTYYYRVAAQNSAGFGAWSAVVSALTPSGAYVSNGTTWVGAGVFYSDGTDWLPCTISVSDGTNWIDAT